MKLLNDTFPFVSPVKVLSHCLVVLLILLLHVQDVSAQRWVSFDTQARGMGQSGMAHISSPAAIYLNPANLNAPEEPKTYYTRLDGVFDFVVEGDVLLNADRLNDFTDEVNIDALQDRFNRADFSNRDVRDLFRLIDTLAALTDPGSGIVTDAGGSISVQRGQWALAYRNHSRIGMAASVDADEGANLAIANGGLEDLNDGLNALVQLNTFYGIPLNRPETGQGMRLSQQLQELGARNGINISQDAGDEFAFHGEQALGARLSDPEFIDLMDRVLDFTGSTLVTDDAVIANNFSGVEIKGINLQDITVGRGFTLPGPFDSLRMGISGRLVRGNTFRRAIIYRELENGKKLIGDAFDSFDYENRTTYRGTLDAGVSYTPHHRVTLALAAHNIIPHKYGFIDGSVFRMDTQVRAGIALRAFDWLTLTLDGDLKKNETSALPGYESRILGGGFEVASSIGKFEYALRGGTFVNLALDDDNQVYTLGFKLKRGPFTLSTEGHITASNVDIEAASTNTPLRDFPNRLGGSVSIGLDIPF